MKSLFAQISRKSERQGNYLINNPYSSYLLEEGQIYYSVCVFKFNSYPSFISEPIDGWIETKLAYLVIVEFEGYLVVTKKNVSGMNDFFKELDPIDYDILSTIFIDDGTQFEKFGLKNMNISDKAIRSKTMESVDLKENFSTVGAGSYVVDNLRVNNGDEKVALSLNTSRVNKFGSKNSLHTFFQWASNVVEKVENYTEQETFLTVFAQPISFERNRHDLIPIAALFLFTKLYEDFENGRITSCMYITEDGQREVNIFFYLKSFQSLLQIRREENDNGDNHYFADTTLTNDLEFRINSKSITVFSRKLHKVKLVMDSGQVRSITEYINTSNQFIVNFDHLDLIYTNRKLFRDSKLLGNIEYFLNAFKPYPELETIISEKGTFLTTSTEFEDTSVFGFVENTFKGNFDYFICDDLGKEWADHIGVNTDTITFYHSKYKDTNYSASAFQDIVGQGLKNLSNLSPAGYQIDSKIGFWESNYRNNGIQTDIIRLRRGNSVSDASIQFKNTIKNPNFTREIYLVVNFISKAGLQQKLEDLRDGIAFAERNEVIQILWFLSSFLSVCSEQGVRGYICCKP
ncbi:MAG: hypothetical protein RBR78_00020 [Flavobacteriaceae bacterium]|nr:hypothetical protein [Flavobacteriaceae bacterium]